MAGEPQQAGFAIEGSARCRDDVEAIMSVEGACDWSVECNYFDGKSLQAVQAIVYG